jgi:hypothetical protein
MSRASDFWMTDRAHDLELGGWPLKMQHEVLLELRASRERERELMAALSDPSSGWYEKTVRAVARKAAELLPPVEERGTMMQSVWIGRLARAIERAIHAACADVGLIGDHPGIRWRAKVLLTELRADVRSAVAPAKP